MSAVDEGALIDLHRVAGIIRRRLGLIAVVSALILVATAIAYLLAETRYVAQARVAMERGSEQVLTVEQVMPSVDPDSDTIDTEFQVLTSPGLTRQAVNQLHLS